MPATEAQIRANRQNAGRSTGPRTIEGKERSRQNALKHGLSGSGVVVAPDDAVEVDRRDQALQTELAPKSALGSILVRQLATLSVRMERGAKQELARIASRVRHAAEDFDVERIETAEALLNQIADDPRRQVRQLRRRPEGVALLVEAWQRLRSRLTHAQQPNWTVADFEAAAHLDGLTVAQASGTPLQLISRTAFGVINLTTPEAEAKMERADRMAWGRSQLVEWIDRQIADLETHAATLDVEAIDQDRAEAGDRALFDPSPEASKARRYEAEARRGFYKALEAFRQEQATKQADNAPSEPDTTETTETLASFREEATKARGSVPEIPPVPRIPSHQPENGRHPVRRDRQVAIS